MIGIPRILASWCLVAAGAGNSIAGVQLTGKNVNLLDNKTSDIVMLIDGTRLRTNVKSADSDTSIIFESEGDDYKAIILDNKKKEYRVFDRKTMEEISAKIGGAMAQMQEQMKKMTPEQRAMIEKMMGKMGVAGGEVPVPEITFKKVGSETVNGRPCTKYEGLLNGQKVSELCAAPADSLNLSPADLAVFEKMTSMFQEMTKSIRQLPFLRASTLKLFDKQIDGVPVQEIHFQDGKPSSKFEIVDSARRNFSDDDYSVGSAKQVELNLGQRGR